MNEFFNWNDFGYVIHQNLWWLLLAFAIGIFVGWRTCDMSSSRRT